MYIVPGATTSITAICHNAECQAYQNSCLSGTVVTVCMHIDETLNTMGVLREGRRKLCQRFVSSTIARQSNFNLMPANCQYSHNVFSLVLEHVSFLCLSESPHFSALNIVNNSISTCIEQNLHTIRADSKSVTGCCRRMTYETSGPHYLGLDHIKKQQNVQAHSILV